MTNIPVLYMDIVIWRLLILGALVSVCLPWDPSGRVAPWGHGGGCLHLLIFATLPSRWTHSVKGSCVLGWTEKWWVSQDGAFKNSQAWQCPCHPEQWGPIHIITDFNDVPSFINLPVSDGLTSEGRNKSHRLLRKTLPSLILSWFLRDETKCTVTTVFFIFIYLLIFK